MAGYHGGKVWEATGCTRLAVDANRALTSRDALRLSRECADIPLVLEQPCNTMEEIAAIRAQRAVLRGAPHHAVVRRDGHGVDVLLVRLLRPALLGLRARRRHRRRDGRRRLRVRRLRQRPSTTVWLKVLQLH